MRIELYKNVDGDFMPYIDTFLLAGACTPLGAVLVLPGGGYRSRAAHEGDSIARRFNALGYHAVVLQYRVAPNRYPAALNDVCRVLKLIRQNAASWKIDPEHIAVCGFSAGGHLTGTSGIFYNEALHTEGDEADARSCRPDALIMSYPVVSISDDFAHKNSGINLLGEDAPRELYEKMDLHKRVTPDTPPAFIWHTATDGSVPVKNAMVFAESMWNCGNICELHVFPEGAHGRGLGVGTAISQWTALAANFLSVTLDFPRA